MFAEKARYLLLFLIIFISRSLAGQGSLYSLGMGIAGIGNETLLAESGFEYRFQKKFFIFSPMAGMMVMGDGSKYFYGGINFINYYGKRLMISPNFAFGGFHNGGEKNLGGVIEFRSGIEVGYWISDQLMVGTAFHHISNASIYEKNPGTETLSLILTVGSRPRNKSTKKCFDNY